MPEPSTSANALADELFGTFCAQEPVLPTMFGIDGRHDLLSDISVEAEQDYRARYAGLVDRATALDPAALSAQDRTTRAVVIQQAAAKIDEIDSLTIEHTVTDFMIAPASILLTYLPQTSLPDADHANAYLDRLAAIPGYLRAAAQRHRAGIAAGRVSVAHLVESAVKQVDRYLADPDNDPLTRLAVPADAPADHAARRAAILADVVRPAFAEYRDVLVDEVLPHGRAADRAGLGWLPGGDAAYAAMVRVHTTTARSPDDLHETGLAIIDRLAAEYAEVGRRVLGTTDLAEIFRRLRNDRAFRWTSEEELLDSGRSAIVRAEAAAPDWFGLLPAHPCEVAAVPAESAAGAPMAYYLQPALDGSRPGIYFANTSQVTERFRHQAEATAYHEAVPGHHFQMSIAQQLTELPLMRRIAPISAYVEGWGLYAERLADEMGLYSDDVARLGMLATDSMRAGRLVVDTGLHAKGWSRRRAVEYLAENTPLAPLEIESEVDRYIAFAGQALSYMVGRLEIQRVRGEAERTLGDRFDIRAFHDVVLGNGSLPLTVLADVVAEWVAGRAA